MCVPIKSTGLSQWIETLTVPVPERFANAGFGDAAGLDWLAEMTRRMQLDNGSVGGQQPGTSGQGHTAGQESGCGSGTEGTGPTQMEQ